MELTVGHGLAARITRATIAGFMVTPTRPALKATMEVFWSKGCERAQVADLTAAMGINPPSFYAAFGGKEAAFREAVDLYVETVGSTSMRALADASSVRSGLRAMLEGNIDIALSSSSSGFLLILGVVNCLAENEAARTYLKQARAH